MVSTAEYFARLNDWSQEALTLNGIVKLDSPFYQAVSLGDCQRTDLSLLLQSLKTTDANRIHLRCDEWQQYDKVYGLLLATLCFYKYAQNQLETPVSELYKIGTVLHNPVSGDARVVLGHTETGIIARPIRGHRVRINGMRQALEENSPISFSQLAKYIPLANVSEHDYNRNALGNLAGYASLFSRTVRDYRALTTFPRRLLVVAPHATIEQLPNDTRFPIRYQFEQHYTVPVVTPLVEIVTRYADARERLWSDDSLDEVVVMGDIGCRDSINELLNDLGDDYFKRLIILGGQPLQADYGFRYWSWSRNERTWLRSGKLTDTERIILPGDELKSLRSLFIEPAQQLVGLGLPEATANGAINRLVGQHLRDAIVDGAELLAYQQSLLNDIESVWRSWFADASHLDHYPDFCRSLMDGLRKVADCVAQNPAKLDKILALAEQFQSQNKSKSKTWVVARQKQAEALNRHFTGSATIEAISYRELKTLLNNPAAGQPEQFVFPALHLDYQPGGQLLRYYRLHRQALERGQCYLLSYEGLEDGLVNLCEYLHQFDEHQCLTHPDRKHWVDFACISTLPALPDKKGIKGMMETLPANEAIGGLLNELETPNNRNPEQPTRTDEVLLKINDWFTEYFGVWKDIGKIKREKTSHIQRESVLPLNGFMFVTHENNTRYNIKFSNCQQPYECGGRVRFARILDNETESVHPGQLRKGDRIVHFDITLHNCFDILHTLDEVRPLLDEIKWASQAWRKWLQKSVGITMSIKNCTEYEARQLRYQRLKDNLRTKDEMDEFVEFARFETWLGNKDKVFFPRSTHHLEAILESHLNQFKETDKTAKRLEMQRILDARHQSTVFPETITRLHTELTRYLIDKTKGVLLSDFSQLHLTQLLNTQGIRTVEGIVCSNTNENPLKQAA